jgi:hypothetical protein
MNDQQKRYSDEVIRARRFGVKDLDVDLKGPEWDERTDIRSTPELVNKIPDIVSPGAARKAAEIVVLLDTFLAELRLVKLSTSDSGRLGQNREERVNNAATAMLAVLERLKTLSDGDKINLLYTYVPTANKRGLETKNSILTTVLGDVVTVLTQSYKILRLHVNDASGVKAKDTNKSIELVATGIIDALDFLERMLPQSVRLREIKLKFSVKVGRELARNDMSRIEEEESNARGENGYIVRTRDIPPVFWKVVGLGKFEFKEGQKARNLHEIWQSISLKALELKTNPAGLAKEIKAFLFALSSLKIKSLIILSKTGFLEMAAKELNGMLTAVFAATTKDRSLDRAQKQQLYSAVNESKALAYHILGAAENALREDSAERMAMVVEKEPILGARDDTRIRVGRSLLRDVMAQA